ncbi:MAG: 5-oxoprolinase subunit PxpA [Idiomarina sp.]|nr:5-oxoprolinase subunit PxpA [Idiomarina sp.]
MKLNCDLGESYGAWSMGQDAQLMPLIDQANIACGMHASDPVTLLRTVKLAIEHGVEIGAHPGYPDKEGFGRRAMALTPDEVYALVLYQVAALDGVARSQGGQVGYVKPHGALYHAMMNDKLTRIAIMQAVADYPAPLNLVMLATADYQRFEQEAGQLGGAALTLRFEAFADRAYTDEGQLMPRGQSGAVHHELARVVAQAEQIAAHGKVTTHSGRSVKLPAQTLCVHGDTDAALAAVKAIRHMLVEHSAGV